jgi:hypothetical protein
MSTLERQYESANDRSKIMDTQQVMVHGWISQDGILEINEKLNLPPGPVHVTVQAVSPPSGREDTRKALEAIWAERKLLGLKDRTKQEIDAKINSLRDESEEEICEVERLYNDVHKSER